MLEIKIDNLEVISNEDLERDVDLIDSDNEDLEKDVFNDVIYRSYRQGGTRYSNAIDENGVNFKWDFLEDIYMLADPIWDQLSPDGQSKVQFKPLVVADIFGNSAPLHVEIGAGNGEFIAHHAATNSNTSWIGFEVFHKVFEKAVNRAKKVAKVNKINNIRLLQFDAELFVRMLPDSSVEQFYVNFPDPWPKAKHHKRRLLKPWFIDLLRCKLKVGGSITIATDHDAYAEEITENLAEVQGLESTLGAPFINDIGDYYQTKYYRKFAKKGTVYFYNRKRTK